MGAAGFNYKRKPLLALTQPAVMVYYDSEVSADTSSHGLGAMLLQLHNNSWKPVAFAS